MPERAALHRLAAHLDYLFIDEAQNVPEIGRVLKLLHDTFPTLRIAAERVLRVRPPATDRLSR